MAKRKIRQIIRHKAEELNEDGKYNLAINVGKYPLTKQPDYTEP